MLLERFLEDSAERFGSRVALVADGRRLTYAELDRRANQLAWTLIANGVRRGERVLVQLDNSVEAVLAVFAILKASAVFVMVNPTTKSAKLRYIARNCDAAALITDKPHADAARLIANEGCPRVVLQADDVIMPTAEAPSASASDAGPPLRSERPPKQNIDMDLAALIYTSGSTGGPKGVMMTHANMIAAATSISTYLELRHTDVILNVLPLSFDYGLYQIIMAFKVGARVVLERSFAYPAAILEKIVAEKVTGLPIVPTMSALLLQLDLRKWDLTGLRFLTNTGAVLPGRHIASLRAALPEASIYSMYGLTECKRVSYLPPSQIDIRPGSVGRGMPNEEVYIVDEDGNRVGPGEVGELVVRGANVMKGYWNNPEATAKALRQGPHPWEKVLYSGDLFRTDDEGYLYYVGRRDEIIKSRGEKVSPREVEEVLHAMPGIAEAAVIGVPDKILGTAVKAVIVPRKEKARGEPLTKEAVLRHCRSQLEDFMVPKIVEFRDSLPKTATGKVAKKELVDDHASVIQTPKEVA